MKREVCPNCGGVLVAESRGWKCKGCGGFISLQSGKFYEYVEKPFMPPQTNADRVIAMIQNGNVRDLLDWWQEILKDGVPGDDYFKRWLKQPVKDGEGDAMS